MGSLYEIIPEIMDNTLSKAMSLDDARKVKLVLCNSSTKDYADNLADIIVGRIKSLVLMKSGLMAGRSI